MILAALALVAGAQAAPAAPPAATGDDIVVTAQMLRRLRMDVDLASPGTVRSCKVTVSSGSTDLDRQACASVRQCVRPDADDGDTVADCVDAALLAYVGNRKGDRPSR